MWRPLSVLVWFGFVSLSVAQSQLTLPQVNAPPGTQVSVPLILSNSEAITAIQCRVHFDPGLLTTSADPYVTPGGAITDHSIGVTEESGVVSLVVFSGSLSPFKEGTHVLVNLVFMIQSTAPPDASTPLTLSEINSSDAEAQAVAVTAQNGGITFSSTGNIPEEGANAMVFPQFANGSFAGGDFGVVLILVNRTAAPATGLLDLVKSDGSPFVISLLDGRTDSSFTVDVPAGGATFLQSDGQGPLSSGYARVSATAPLGGTLLFRMRDGRGNTLTEAGVGDSPFGSRFMVPVLYEAPSVNTGIAIANLFDLTVEVDLTLRDEFGAEEATSTLSLAGGEHRPRFATEFFPLLLEENDFKGSLLIEASSDISVIALKQDGVLLTTFPAVRMDQ